MPNPLKSYLLTTATLLGLLGLDARAQTPTVTSTPTTAHWHCSKHPNAPALNLANAAEQDDLFNLSTAHPGVVGLTLPDLIEVFKGHPVQMGQRQLTACFLSGKHPLNQSALERVGLQWTSLEHLRRLSANQQNHVQMVHSEAEMLQCIANNYPSVGYVSQPTETPALAPCF